MDDKKLLEVEKLVSIGEIESAIDLILHEIINSGSNESRLKEIHVIKENLAAIRLREMRGEESLKLKKERNEIVSIFHSFISQMKSDLGIANLSSSDINGKIKQIKNHISAHDLRNSFDLIDEIKDYYPDFSGELMILSYRWKENERRMTRGVIFEKDYMDERNQVVTTLYDVVKQIERI